MTHTEPVKGPARGVRTNGVAQQTSAHLNKTCTLADVWAEEATKPAPQHSWRGHDKREVARKIRYAGAEVPEPDEPAMDYVPLDMLKPCSWRFLVRLAALRSGVQSAEILGVSRERPIVAARYDAMVLTYQHTQASMVRIGQLFGRDHTTVVHAMRKLGRRQKLVDAAPPPPDIPPEKPEPSPRSRTALQKAIRRAYHHQIPPSVIAEEYGCSARSVKVIAHRLGLRRADFAGAR